MKKYKPDDFDFERELKKINNRIKKPHILICGATGVGKSSVINHIFGSKLAQVGHGQPLTKGIIKYQQTDISTVLYDTEGYELGLEKTSRYKENIESWLNETKKTPVHEAWYCISAGNKRLTDMDIAVIDQIKAHRIPVAVILTQIDTVDEAELLAMEKVIASNCEVVFFRTCVSEDRKLLEVLEDYLEWEKLLDWSISHLEEGLREGLISALQISLKRKKNLVSQKVIPFYISAAAGVAITPIPFSDAALLVPIQMKMTLHIMKTYALDQKLGGISSLVGSMVVSESGRLLAQNLSTSLLKLIPGFGTVIGVGVNTTVASAFTAAMGFAMNEMCFQYAKAINEGEKDLDVNHYFNRENIENLMGQWLKGAKK